MAINEILLVGNPNAGKSTLFNQLTGLKQQVGNFPGITVEKSFGEFKTPKISAKLVDLPGVYALMPQQQSSQDERVTLSYLLESQNSIVLNVLDATCLERHLYLTLQLRELGIPMLVMLNKWDLAKQQNISLDVEQLSQLLQCPVLTINANDKLAPQQLEQAIITCSEVKSAKFDIDYEAEIESLINQLKHHSTTPSKFHAILMLIDQQYQQQINADVELSVASTRYQRCHDIFMACMVDQTAQENVWSEKLDSWLLKPWLAIPTFLLAMYLMFMFAINIGGAFIDFFDIAVGAIFVDGLAHVLNNWHWPQLIVVLLTDGVGTGVQTVSTFIPLIFCLYLFLTTLEQSGYLARAAVVTDRLMQKMGLPGSAFVPLMMGFGCTVPAVMATRTLKQKRERILSSAMSHFMVCGARLPVFALFGAAFFLHNALTIVFLLYILGIVAALITGVILRNTVLKGDASPFIIELPQYQIPRFGDLFNRSVQRLKGFVFGAGKTIVLVVTVLGLINSLGRDGSFGNQGTENSLLSTVGQVVTPVFKPMGIEQNNWQATVGIFTGLFAKEVLVATLNSLYQDNATVVKFNLKARMQEALQSIPDHFSQLSKRLYDPLGLSSANVKSIQEAATSQNVSMTTMERMASHFHGKIGAFSFLLFVLLYAPCASALGAIAREFTGRWALFIALWSTSLAYLSASLFYQFATMKTLISSQGGMILMLLFFAGLLLWLLKQTFIKQWLDGGSRYVAKHPSHSC